MKHFQREGRHVTLIDGGNVDNIGRIITEEMQMMRHVGLQKHAPYLVQREITIGSRDELRWLITQLLELDASLPEDKTAVSLAPLREPNYDILNMKVNFLKLGARSINCLKAEGITYVGDLARCTEQFLTKKVPNLGAKSFREIRLALIDVDLNLEMTLLNWERPA